MGAYDDLLPEKKSSTSAYADLLPKKANDVDESWFPNPFPKTGKNILEKMQSRLNSALPGAGDVGRGTLQSLGDLPLGLIELLANKSSSILSSPIEALINNQTGGLLNKLNPDKDSRIAPAIGDSVTQYIKDREARYQADTPGSVAAGTGRALGTVAPFLGGPLKAAVSKPFEVATTLAQRLLPNSPKLAQVAGASGGGLLNVPLLTALQPSHKKEGESFEDAKFDQAALNAAIAIGLPPTLNIGGSLLKNLLGKPLLSVVHAIDAQFIPGGAQRAGGRIYNAAAGTQRSQLEAALLRNAGTNQNAAQSTVDVGNTETAALQKLLDKLANPTGADAVRQSQIAGRQTGVESVTPNLEKLTKIKSEQIGPRLTIEYQKANEAGEKLPDFVARMQVKYKDQKDFLTQLGKFASLENQSLNMAGKAVGGQNKFGWLPKANRHLTNARSEGEAAQEAADLYKGVSADKAFIQRQIDSLAQSGHNPLTAKSLFGALDDIALAPGGSDQATQSLMKNLGSELQAMVDLNLKRLTKGMGAEQAKVFASNYQSKFGDIIDAQDLHQFRKTGIAFQIEKLTKESAPSTAKHLASKVGSVKQAIDDALEGSGADAFKRTLRINQRLSRAQDQSRVLTELKTQLKPEIAEAPEAFLNRIGKDSKSFLESMNVFETDAKKLFTAGQWKKLQSIRGELNRDARVDELAKQGMGKAQAVTHADEIPTAPGFVDYRITLLNKAKNIIEGKGADSAFKALQKAMAPGEQKELIKMMNSADPKMRKAAMDVFKRYGPDAKSRLIIGSKLADEKNQQQQ